MKITRREFLKCTAASSAFMAIGVPFSFAAAKEKNVDHWVKGVCRFCGTGCGVMVGVKAKKVVPVTGDPNNHNAGFLCLKGALMPPIIYAKERVTEPLIRKNGKLTEKTTHLYSHGMDSRRYAVMGFSEAPEPEEAIIIYDAMSEIRELDLI